MFEFIMAISANPTKVFVRSSSQCVRCDLPDPDSSTIPYIQNYIQLWQKRSLNFFHSCAMGMRPVYPLCNFPLKDKNQYQLYNYNYKVIVVSRNSSWSYLSQKACPLSKASNQWKKLFIHGS